jgi:hypothetical protein
VGGGVVVVMRVQWRYVEHLLGAGRGGPGLADAALEGRCCTGSEMACDALRADAVGIYKAEQ